MDLNKLLALEQIALMEADAASSEALRKSHEELARSYGRRLRALAFPRLPKSPAY